MAFIREYTDGDYEIIQYTCGGSVRNRLSQEIVAEYTNFWTTDGGIHRETKKEIDYINQKLSIKITP